MAMNVASADERSDEDQMNFQHQHHAPRGRDAGALLIIFLTPCPVVTQSIPLELPKERNLPTQTKPENILIAVNKDRSVPRHAPRDLRPVSSRES
jgi:biopolymer transport protein ExbD